MSKRNLVTLLKQLNRLRKQRPYYPSHFSTLLGDFFRLPYLKSKDVFKYSGEDFSQEKNLQHLQAAMQWLCYAQDFNNDGGVSTSYSFCRGWESSYPETTGYIIPTFFDYFYFTGLEEYRCRALKMADWLLSIQLPVGAFQGGPINVPPVPSVFNTGQIILGLVRTHKETANEMYINSAEKAARFLIEVQDTDGAWRKYAYNGIPHAYYTRVAWCLLEVYNFTKNAFFKDAAVKNLEWALSIQGKNGWIRNNSFETNINPFTHNIVYVAEGLLESGIILGESKFINSADLIAKVLFMKFEIGKYLAGDFDENWSSKANYSCLTGDAQLSALLIRLYELKGDERYLNAALKINQYLKSTQSLTSNNPGIYGGIKGSDPIWGEYLTYRYPNWATKFFVDALLLEERIVESLKKK